MPVRPPQRAVPESGASRTGVGPAVMLVAVLGPALLAFGVAGLVPPMRGLDAPPLAFRLVTVPWLLPGAWMTYRGCAEFRREWRTVEQSGPSRKAIRRALIDRQGELYGFRPPWSRPVLWNWAVGLSGLFQAAAGLGGFLLGLVGGWLALTGEEGPGELLTSAAVVVAGSWVCSTGARRYGRRAVPGWCMEAKRTAVSVRLRRRLETLVVFGLAATWLVVGQIILAFDLAG